MTQSELLNRVRERGETDYLPEDDGPLSCCDEFLTPVHHHIILTICNSTEWVMMDNRNIS